jgi:hypothetical protein
MQNHLKNARVAFAVGTSATALALGVAVPASAGVAAGAAPTSKSASLANECRSWIDGEWGHGACINEWVSGRTMHLHVECNAWWDANIDRSIVVPAGETTEAQGHCYSSVDYVQAYFE